MTGAAYWSRDHVEAKHPGHGLDIIHSQYTLTTDGVFTCLQRFGGLSDFKPAVRLQSCRPARLCTAHVYFLQISVRHYSTTAVVA